MSHPYYFELQWRSLAFAKIEGSIDIFGYHKFKFFLNIKYPIFYKEDKYYLVWDESTKSIEKWTPDYLIPF